MQTTCDRCNEVNSLSDVTIVEISNTVCEVVCSPCMRKARQQGKKSSER